MKYKLFNRFGEKENGIYRIVENSELVSKRDIFCFLGQTHVGLLTTTWAKESDFIVKWTMTGAKCFYEGKPLIEIARTH
jgi:hypothetical protein